MHKSDGVITTSTRSKDFDGTIQVSTFSISSIMADRLPAKSPLSLIDKIPLHNQKSRKLQTAACQEAVTPVAVTWNTSALERHSKWSYRTFFCETVRHHHEDIERQS